jgi:DNA-binding IclR family transcriptional regulator
VARELQLPVPTVHRILAALKQLGYVQQDATSKRFRLGPAAMSLAARTSTLSDLRAVAIEPLRRLAQSLGETSLLTGLNSARDASVCLERVESPQPLRLSVEPGRQLPLHAGASQKALLAFMEPSEMESLLARPLERLCRATVSDARRLREELRATRERGFAVSYEETNLGVWGVAVPVVSGGDVLCAVGVAGPGARLRADLVRRSVRLCHDAAEDVAKALGHCVPAFTVGDTASRLAERRRRP